MNLDQLKLNNHSTVAIAGGGLLGRLLAWRLLEAGHRVTLYDAGSLSDSPSAAQTAAGMISPISEAIDTEPLMYDLGVASLALWPKWLQQLAVDATPVPYAQNGSLIVAHHRDVGLLQQYTQDMQRQLPEAAQGRSLDKQGIAALESDLGEHFQQGLFLAKEAHIDNRQLLRVLLQRIKKLGGDCVENTAVDVEPNCVRLLENNSTVSFDLVMDCRGVGSKPQWQGVRGVRGEVLRVQTEEVSLQRPVRLLHPRYQLYIVPKANQEFVIGATQIESEDRSPISVQSALELNSALYTLNPAFAEARIIEMQSNLRPALNDNRPQIQYKEGLIKVNGLYRHGYLLAPVVVQHALALIGIGNAAAQSFSGVLFCK
ncbi:Glycine oxidase ThiO [gamma proteobacterium IMCC1989]|nr:Glycine oxidase ThiO [gamma proteobacterium IMCC1989]